LDNNITPMIAQYHSIKKDYQDALLLFRLGDFYELFYEDALIGSRELNIVLTKKKVSKDKDIPMCGIPYHSADSYISRLVMKGYKVAICEQLEPATPGKVVKREVIRVLTPGTYFDNDKIKSGLSAILEKGNKYAVSYLDLSTGEFLAAVLEKDEILSFISKFQPKEILTLKDSDLSLVEEYFKNIFITRLDEEFFDEKALKELLEFFNITHFYSLGFSNEEISALYSAGAVLKYARISQKSFLPFIKLLKPYKEDIYMRLDYSAQKHLEIINANDGSISLYQVINRALTGMGKRKLKFLLLHPLKNIKQIKERQEAVEELINNHKLRTQIREYLENIYDIERLISRISSNTLTPKDMVTLRESLKIALKMKDLSTDINSSLLKDLFNQIEDLGYLVEKLDKYLEDNPPIHLKEGGLIKYGVDERLDELKDLKEKAVEWIRNYQEKLRNETGIQSLKIGFNKVMGYYIEITKPNLKFVPDYFKRRQTLSNAERFTTDELQSFEEKVLSADEKIKALEYEIFSSLREEVSSLARQIAKTAESISMIDALTSLAQIAVEKFWTKPEISEDYKIDIKEGYHPVIKNFYEDFVPNSLCMDKDKFFHIITGPNMAGKSTFIRQSAIIIILAQIGSFVPAEKAEIGIVDAIFTRIGSGDALAKGLSTFMVEMLEMANILNNATEKSFIVLDEVGRGTSTYDGLSIAMAISDYIVNNIKAKTLFATHYHELTQMEYTHKGVKNFHMAVKEEDNHKITFLYKVMEGFSSKSYGIHVAKLAGIRDEIIKKAYEYLYKFETKKEDTDILKEDLNNLKQEIIKYEMEPDFSEIINEILDLDLATTTPLQALMILNDLKNRLKIYKK